MNKKKNKNRNLDFYVDVIYHLTVSNEELWLDFCKWKIPFLYTNDMNFISSGNVWAHSQWWAAFVSKEGEEGSASYATVQTEERPVRAPSSRTTL